MPATRKRSSPPEEQRDGQRRARAQAERVGQPDADLGLVGAAQPAAGDERRLLEHRVVARVGDHVDRLAQRERVGRLDLVARRGGGDAGDPRASATRGSAGSVAVSW